jgi:polysaccharide export outer membrane protein
MSNFAHKFTFLGGLLYLTLLSACSSYPKLTQEELKTGQPDTAITQEDYQIGVDDTVQVSVWRNPELSVTVPVRPDGKISMPLIGDVRAGGLTPEEVASEIKKKLTSYIRDPQVAVILTALHSHEYLTRVRVTGAVRNPSSLPHRQGMTVLDAVLASGGVTEFAAPGRAKLYRTINNEIKTMTIDLDAILNGGKLETNYTLRPGDVITVPERLF